MTYAIVKVLRGGTFTPAAGADWWTQFVGAPQYCAVPTFAGEINFAASTGGLCGYYCFYTINPVEVSIDVEASAAFPTQIYINPGNGLAVPDYELAAAGVQAISFPGGFNTFAVIRAEGPLIVVPQGTIFNPSGSTSTWTSPFYPRADPFAEPTDPGGPGGPSPTGTPDTIGASTV